MGSVILGFIINILMFIVNFVLGAIVKSLEVTVSTLVKTLETLTPEKVKEGIGVASRIGATSAKVASEGAKLAVKAGASYLKVRKAVNKVSFEAAKASIKITIFLIKKLIQFIKFLINLITVIASSSTLIIIFVVIPLCLLLIVVIIIIAVNVTTMKLEEGEKQSGYSAEVGVSTYSYMDIDWSQDFSDKLDLIESTYGREQRNVVEWVIICMNTQQNLEETNIPVEGYFVSSIIVESGGTDFMGESEGYPSDSYALKHTDNGLEYPYAAGSGGSPSSDGAFQITTESWVGYNPLYASNSLKLSPVITPETPWYTMRYYCPTVAYGTLVKYNGAVYGDSYEFFDSNGVSSISHAFQLMGVEETEGKRAFIKNACLASYAYAGLVDDCHSSRSDAKHDLATNIAIFVLCYCENYLEYDSVKDTYTFTEESTKLATSVVTSNCNVDSTSLLISNSLCKSVYGSTRKGDLFSETVYSDSSFGVLDKSGNPIQGTIDGYLLSIMPEDAKSFFESTASDTLDHMSNTSKVARCYYDVSMLIAGNYMLETTVSLLGLRVESIDSDWMTSYQAMGEWYATNVNTYCSYIDNSNGTSGGRSWYYCELLNANVGDDCSSFVTACLAYDGVIVGYTGGTAPTSHDFKPESGKPIVTSLTNAGYVWIPLSNSVVLQAGDITVMNGHVEIVGGVSGDTVYYYSWGNNYNVSRGDKGGLPRSESVTKYFSDTRIVGFWRRVE